LRKRYPPLPVIIFSTLSRQGAAATLEALSSGANDYVTKPANVGSVTEAMERLQIELIPKIKAHCRHLLPSPATLPPIFAPAASPPPTARPLYTTPIDVVCIGTSTGGPNALADVFRDLPADLPVPVVIVQHMPPMFTALLAERLNAQGKLRCHEGADGQVIERGHAYLAPGGHHMVVARTGGLPRLHLHDGPMENSCRPAVDVLFRSVAAMFGGAVLAVVMTGMGQDGTRGCAVIREAGGRVIVQDEPSSVVWGMPGQVAQSGLAERILPLSQIGPEICRLVRTSRRLR
jgi:two-component system chemotaxis response regulator CheB